MKRINKKIGKNKNKRLCLSIFAIIMLLFVSASVYASEIKSDGETTQAMEEENKTVESRVFSIFQFSGRRLPGNTSKEQAMSIFRKFLYNRLEV